MAPTPRTGKNIHPDFTHGLQPSTKFRQNPARDRISNMTDEKISTHIPREGDDGQNPYIAPLALIFQSTSPVVGTTRWRANTGERGTFQSTCPVGGTTKKFDSFK